MDGASIVPAPIRYRYERGDFLASVCALRRRSIFGRVYLICLWALVASWLLGAVFGFPAWWKSSVQDDALLNAAMVGLLLFVHFASPLSAWWSYRRLALAGKVLEVSLQPTLFAAQGEGVRIEIAWESVRRLIETKRHLILALSPHEATVLPRRAFPSEDAYRIARAFIAARVGAEIEAR